MFQFIEIKKANKENRPIKLMIQFGDVHIHVLTHFRNFPPVSFPRI